MKNLRSLNLIKIDIYLNCANNLNIYLKCTSQLCRLVAVLLQLIWTKWRFVLMFLKGRFVLMLKKKLLSCHKICNFFTFYLDINITAYLNKSKIRANVLKTTRNSVRLYLDSYKIFNNKWIFSSSELSKEQLSKFLIPSIVWEVVTGELLGDGHLSYDPLNKPQINGRLEFTFSAKILHYVNYFKFNVLSPICTYSNPTPWLRMEGKEPTQYWFCTKSLPAITNLYKFWYKQIDGKFIKVLPFNIEELLTPIALAHWIMGDAYFTEGILKLCTDNFTKNEVLRLIDVLYAKYGIKATINKRTNPSAPRSGALE